MSLLLGSETSGDNDVVLFVGPIAPATYFGSLGNCFSYSSQIPLAIFALCSLIHKLNHSLNNHLGKYL